MQLSEVFIIKNHPGLFKAVDTIGNSFAVESLEDGRRLPLEETTDEAFCLGELELHGKEKSICLQHVFKKMSAEQTEPTELLQSDVKIVKDYFERTVPEMDQSRVFSSDMRRIVSWFSLLRGKVDFNAETAEIMNAKL